MIPSVGWGWKWRSAFLEASGIGKDLCCLDGLFIAFPRNVAIGPRTFLNRNVSITAPARISIGADCLVGPNVVMNSADHSIRNGDPIRLAGHVMGEITIGDNVWIGANVVITKGVTIGSHSVVGAGAVVTSAVREGAVVGGVPARELSRRLVL